MSIAEMKQKAVSLIDKTENESLLQKVLTVLEAPEPRPSIEQIFEEAKAQYGNTLRRLAE